MNPPGAAVRFGLMTITVLSLGVALFSYRYLIPGAPLAAPQPFANHFTKVGVLTVHAAFAATALLIGPFQFRRQLRVRRPALHRRLGTVYVACAMIAGAAGLMLAFGVNTGPVAGAGFGLLAAAWLATTANAWRFARRRDLVRHPRWMVRSFALCLAAVTLRIYLGVSQAAGMPFDAVYPAIAWLCWVPNLLIAEIGLRLWDAAPRRATSPLAR